MMWLLCHRRLILVCVAVLFATTPVARGNKGGSRFATTSSARYGWKLGSSRSPDESSAGSQHCSAVVQQKRKTTTRPPSIERRQYNSRRVEPAQVPCRLQKTRRRLDDDRSKHGLGNRSGRRGPWVSSSSASAAPPPIETVVPVSTLLRRKRKRVDVKPTQSTAGETVVESPQISVYFQTKVGQLAQAFQSVLVRKGEEEDSRDGETWADEATVDVVRLLEASRFCEASLKDLGQNMAARELEKNCAKAQALYQQAPAECRDSLRSLLEYEKGLGIHKPGGMIKDPSGAVGFLWIRRCLSYQYQLHCNILRHLDDHDGRVDEMDETCSVRAAAAAYEKELEPYHGWALRKVNNLAMRKMPHTKTVLRRVGGFSEDHFGEPQEEATLHDMRELVSTWEPLLEHWKQIYRTLDLEDPRRY